MQIICNKKKFITYIVPILTKLKVTSIWQKRIHILALQQRLCIRNAHHLLYKNILLHTCLNVMEIAEKEKQKRFFIY